MSTVPEMEYKIEGNLKGPTIFLLAGWPDTFGVWQRGIVNKYEDKYRIVTCALPGYTEASSKKLPFFGYTFDQVTASFVNAVELAMASDKSGQKPIVIAHDWGCIILNEFRLWRPKMFAKHVMLDVGGRVAGDISGFNFFGLLMGRHMACSMKKGLWIIAYQWLLILAYFLPRFLGNRLTRAFAGLSKAPQYSRNPDKREQGLAGVHAGMNYLYVQMWIHILLRIPLSGARFYRAPQAPVMYCYGTKKPFQFHSDAWLKEIEDRNDGSRVLNYPAGHWFYADPNRPVGARFLNDLDAFINARPQPA